MSFCATQVFRWGRETYSKTDLNSSLKQPKQYVQRDLLSFPLMCSYSPSGPLVCHRATEASILVTFKHPVTKTWKIIPSDRTVEWQWILQSSLSPRLRNSTVILLKISIQLNVSPVFTTNLSSSSRFPVVFFYRSLATKGGSSIQIPGYSLIPRKLMSLCFQENSIHDQFVFCWTWSKKQLSSTTSCRQIISL